MYHHGVIFNFGGDKVCSPALFGIHFSYHKDIWIAAANYLMSFYLIVLLRLNFTDLQFLVY